ERWGGRLFLELLQVFFQEHRDLFRDLGADAHPVFHAIRLEPHALIGVLDLRIVSAQFLDDAAVARLARIDRHNAEELPVLPPHHFHSNTYGHESLLGPTETI